MSGLTVDLGGLGDLKQLYENLKNLVLPPKTPVQPVQELMLQPSPPSVSTFNSYIITLIVEYNQLKEFSERVQEQGEGDGPPPTKFIFSKEYRLEGVGIWQLVLNPDYRNENGERYISALLSMKECFVPFVDVNYVIGILNVAPDNAVAYEKSSGIRRFSKENPLFGWDKYLPFDLLGTNPPLVIRFNAKLSIWSQPLDYPEFSKAAEFWFPKELNHFTIPEKCCRDPDPGSGGGGDQNSTPDQTESQSQNSMRSRMFQKLWNNGTPKGPNALIICRDTKFPIHAEVLAAVSDTIAEHFATQDGFDPLPFKADSEIDPEIMEMMIRFAYCGNFDWKLDPKASNYFGYQPLKNPNFLRFLQIWDASVLLKIREMEPYLSAAVMEAVRINFIQILYQRYLRKVKIFEGRDATTKDFFGYLKEVRQKKGNTCMIMYDFPHNRLAYAKLMFQKSKNEPMDTENGVDCMITSL